MIAIVFLLALLGVTVFAAATTGQALPVAEILMLIGVFVVFFGSGVYIAAVLGAVGVLTGFLFSDLAVDLPRPDAVGAVVQLRAGGGAAVPADGGNPAARGAVGPAVPGVETSG